MKHTFRQYRRADAKTCAEMMKAEGYGPERTFFDAYETWIMESEDEKMIAFLTINMNRRIPHLVHFITNRRHRNFKVGWRLFGFLKARLKAKGISTFTLDCPVKEIKRARMISHLFNTEPYATKNGNHFWKATI